LINATTAGIDPAPVIGKVRRAAAAAAPRDIRDALLESVPTEMSAADLRRLAAAGRAESKKTLELEKIPFGIELELEGFDRDEAAPFIESMPRWNVNKNVRDWKLEGDESLRDGGGEAISPVMTLEGGAEKQIRAVLERLQSMGGYAGRNCGLHIHIDGKVLGKEGLANLMKIALDNEQLIYKLSQNGNPEHRGTIKYAGYRHDEQYYYCKPFGWYLGDPFPMVHAKTPNAFRNAYYNAIPNRLEHKYPRPYLPPVDSDEPFVPDRHDYARYFGVNFNSYWYRGTIEFRLFDASADPEKVISSLKLVLSMIKTAVEGRYDYVQPQPVPQRSRPIPRESYEYFMRTVPADKALRKSLEATFAESGGQVAADEPVTNKQVLAVSALMSKGFTFSAGAEQTALSSPVEVATQLGTRPVDVHSPYSKTVWTLSSDKDLKNLVALYDRAKAEPTLQAADQLRAAGFTLTRGDVDKAPAESIDNGALYDSLWNAGVRAWTPPDWHGERTSYLLQNAETVQKLASLSPQRQQMVRDMQTLLDRRFILSGEDGRPLADTAALIRHANRFATVDVQHPATGGRLRLESAKQFKLYIATELGRDEELDAATRATIARGAEMLQRGLPLVRLDGHAPARSDLAYGAQLLCWREFGKNIKLSEAGLGDLYCLARNEREHMRPAASQVLDRVEELRSHHIAVQLDEHDDVSAQGILATLDSGQPIGLRDPLGNRTEARSLDEFLTRANEALAVPHGMNEPRQSALAELRGMVEGGRISLRRPDNGESVPLELAPWLLERGPGVRLAGSSEEQAYGKKPSPQPNVDIANWDALAQVLQQERGEGPHAELLGHMRSLQERGVQFSYLDEARRSWASSERVPISMQSAFVKNLEGDGVQAHLPKLKLWNHFPRRNIVIKGSDELQRLDSAFAS
jgi:hypothetical protein